MGDRNKGDESFVIRDIHLLYSHALKLPTGVLSSGLFSSALVKSRKPGPRKRISRSANATRHTLGRAGPSVRPLYGVAAIAADDGAGVVDARRQGDIALPFSFYTILSFRALFHLEKHLAPLHRTLLQTDAAHGPRAAALGRDALAEQSTHRQNNTQLGMWVCERVVCLLPAQVCVAFYKWRPSPRPDAKTQCRGRRSFSRHRRSNTAARASRQRRDAWQPSARSSRVCCCCVIIVHGSHATSSTWAAMWMRSWKEAKVGALGLKKRRMSAYEVTSPHPLL